MILTISERPTPPVGRPAATGITHKSITLSWYGSSYDGGSLVTFYKIEVCKADTGNWKEVTDKCMVCTF